MYSICGSLQDLLAYQIFGVAYSRHAGTATAIASVQHLRLRHRGLSNAWISLTCTVLREELSRHCAIDPLGIYLLKLPQSGGLGRPKPMPKHGHMTITDMNLKTLPYHSCETGRSSWNGTGDVKKALDSLISCRGTNIYCSTSWHGAIDQAVINGLLRLRARNFYALNAEPPGAACRLFRQRWPFMGAN
jgi:hypothetical protein